MRSRGADCAANSLCHFKLPLCPFLGFLLPHLHYERRIAPINTTGALCPVHFAKTYGASVHFKTSKLSGDPVGEDTKPPPRPQALEKAGPRHETGTADAA
jgi:hypothetical protein